MKDEPWDVLDVGTSGLVPGTAFLQMVKVFKCPTGLEHNSSPEP